MRWLGVAVAGLICLGGGTPARAAPPPIESFTKWPAIDEVVVSPSGNRLAFIVYGPTGHHQVAVIDLDPVSEARLVGAFEGADVRNVQWLNDDRLVFEGYTRTYFIQSGDGGTFAVNHDGSELRTLIAWARTTQRAGSSITRKVLPYGWFLHSTADDGSDDVFVYRRVDDNNEDLRAIELARLNTRTGTLLNLSHGMPEGARHWLLDAKREPRLVTAYRKGRAKIYWRSGGEDLPWTEVADFDPYTDPFFTPRLVQPDGSMLVEARNGRDTTALYRFDPATRRLDPDPLVAVAGFDLFPILETDSRTRRLLGLHVLADRPVSVWLDASLQRLQQSIDAALPAGRVNRVYCGRCESSRFFVIRSSSDRQPGEYFLFDRSKTSLQRIGTARPWIDEKTQGRRTFHRVTTRDGLSMPVIVTHPVGADPDKPLPAVVLVHGGPWVRGSDLTWQAEAQFLASRGYRVIEPEFRGSDGFGWRHFKAGWKQWGQAMQDDLADAVQWADKQRLVDSSRVCVYGGDYGGYAALMAPITHPGTFRCAAGFAAVTDIELTYSITWSDISQAHKRYGMPVLVGHREKDAEQLAKTSPLKRVAEIKVPVLLGHGAGDRRVPVDHARQFVSAARAAGVDIEPVYYNDLGHGWRDPKQHADFLGRLERFLAKSLQAPR